MRYDKLFMRELSSTKQKILLLLMAGLALGLSYGVRQQIKIVKEVTREWKKIDRNKLQADIRDLYESKLVDVKENKDGSNTFVLTRKGKMRVLTYHFSSMKIQQGKWDGNWRLVIFDIPEKIRSGRDALRHKLSALGFYELQKSVFIFPFECRNEVEFIIEYFNLRKHVRYGIISEIDNDLHLREIFHLA